MGEPACLPDSRTLTREIARDTGETLNCSEPEDRFLGKLYDNGVSVHARAAAALSRDDLEPTELHRCLLRLYPSAGKVRLVTTNFDQLFELAAGMEFKETPEVFSAPVLPPARSFRGIVHVHGSVNNPHEMVLTDIDFGRVYLTEGWARRFLISLFREFKVLFVGYSHNDTVLHYLARSLREIVPRQRYALTAESGADATRWQSLGIKPIPYPQECQNDHSALNEGVNRLAVHVRRGVLEWRNLIRELARRPPPVNKEAADIIEEALRDPTKTRFFTERATLPEWIDWLDERKHLAPLFGHGELSECSGVLSYWLANRFACHAANKLFLLIGKHKVRLHPNLWWKIGHEVSRGEADLDNNVLSRWVSVLLTDIPENSDSHHILHSLGDLCVRHGLFNSLLQIFDAMTVSRLVLKPGFPSVNDEETPIRAELKTIGAPYALWDIWRDHLKPNLNQIAEPLLRIVVGRLEERNRNLLVWGSNESWGRAAIESHGQNRSSWSPNVLIDAARDCLEWLADNQAEAIAPWRNQFDMSEAPLLRRLAIHTLYVDKELTADGKIDCLLDRVDIHDSRIHHEVFRLAGQAYPDACKTSKESLLAAIREYRWVGKTDSTLSDLQLSAWNHLNWFSWLHTKDLACPLARQALDEVTRLLPGYIPREHPDFLSWIGPLPDRGPTVEELLAMPATASLDELLSLQSAEQDSHARLVLVRNLTEAAKRDFSWGIALADELVKAKNWDTNLWRALLYAWMSMELGEDDYIRVLTFLKLTNLHGEHAHEIANVLFSLVQNRGKSYALNLLSQVNRIAITLWQELDRKGIDDQQDDWLRRAHDHPAGRLTEFWLYGLSVWRNAQDPMPDALNDEFRAAFSMIVKDPTLPGKLGRSALVSEFAFLLAADRAWTIENLLPLFDSAGDDWELGREGLARVALYPAVAELLERAFLEAVEWSSSLDEYVRGQFIQRYIHMIAYFVEEPFSTWIPRLFNDGGEDIGEVFTSNLNENYLWEMDEATQREWWRRWLKDYWENRLEGVPYALTPKEIAQMLHWPAKLTAVFPEAVALAMKMGQTTSDVGNLLYSLKNSSLVESFPNELACFLFHLDKIGVQEYWWVAKDLFKRLLESSISEDLKHNLRELMAKQGIEE